MQILDFILLVAAIAVGVSLPKWLAMIDVKKVVRYLSDKFDGGDDDADDSTTD